MVALEIDATISYYISNVYGKINENERTIKNTVEKSINSSNSYSLGRMEFRRNIMLITSWMIFFRYDVCVIFHFFRVFFVRLLDGIGVAWYVSVSSGTSICEFFQYFCRHENSCIFLFMIPKITFQLFIISLHGIERIDWPCRWSNWKTPFLCNVLNERMGNLYVGMCIEYIQYISSFLLVNEKWKDDETNCFNSKTSQST